MKILLEKGKRLRRSKDKGRNKVSRNLRELSKTMSRRPWSHLEAVVQIICRKIRGGRGP
jgi:hypothetical protein